MNIDIVIIDYGCGNLFSVESAVKKITKNYIISSEPEDISRANKMILPGVGSFKVAMENLNNIGLANHIRSECSAGKPILGICLGMQLLLSKGYEHGETEGLDLISGEVIAFKPSTQYRVPHIGWNDVSFSQSELSFMSGIQQGTAFYFVHSYYCKLQESIASIMIDYSDIKVCVGFEKDNIKGVQFHPEKSQDAGLKLLRNFILSE
jgi:glutamine amidotransferase